jgi:SPP1 gp7 family putative phage head morphogenesis protein|nr:MAG TPA_asm: minor capsid protein [Caudoviricetes sp.]
MANSDLGHKLTDKELAKLERRIAKLYREAGEELQATIDAYFEQFKKRDEEMKALIGTVQNGKEWTEADYKQWRLNQIGRGERYQAMRDKVARRATDANAVAVSYTNDATPGIYSLNRNYAAYTIEQVAGNIGFDLWDEQTVKRLMVDQPDLMPYYPPKRALKRGIDLAYGKKQITASVTSSILQGKSIKHMADDLQKRITTMSRDSAIRTARTAVTGAQNAGRMDSYAAAEKMGIKLKKEWLATLDSRTRHSHAMLDGEQVAQDKKFSNGCRFPGDPQGPPWEIYNCRCTLIAAVDGVDTPSAQRRARNPATGQTEVISNMTYAEWAGWKKSVSTNVLTIAIEKIRSADSVSAVSNIMQERTKKTVNLSGMDLDLAKENMEQILRLGDEYGYHFSEIVTTSGRAALGEVKRSGARAERVSLQYPKKYYKDQNSLFTELRKSSTAGESPRLGRRQIGVYTTTHEFAHTLSEELTSRLYGYGEELAFWDEIEEVYKVAKNDRPDELGKYAFSNQNEFLAECFAYAKLGATPNQYADEVLKIVDKYFRRKK